MTIAKVALPSAQASMTSAAVEKFRSFTMAHPRLIEARDELLNAIEGSLPDRRFWCWTNGRGEDHSATQRKTP